MVDSHLPHSAPNKKKQPKTKIAPTQQHPAMNSSRAKLASHCHNPQ